jgi:hypothetical protein
MFGTAKKQQASSTNPSAAPVAQASTKEPSKSAGTSYDLCRKVKHQDGSEELHRVGTVFIRSSGTGGVAYVTDDDGQKYELAIFPRRERSKSA